jgi:hypothetical protein
MQRRRVAPDAIDALAIDYGEEQLGQHPGLAFCGTRVTLEREPTAGSGAATSPVSPHRVVRRKQSPAPARPAEHHAGHTAEPVQLTLAR